MTDYAHLLTWALLASILATVSDGVTVVLWSVMAAVFSVIFLCALYADRSDRAVRR